MSAVVLLLLAGMEIQDPQEGRILDLIRDLGSQEYKIRKKADQKLLKHGKVAVPALKKAVEDKDAERAMRARSLLKRIEAARKVEESRRRADGIPVFVHDTERGIKFKRDPYGRMELTVPEENEKTGEREYRTYKADSIEDFEKKNPVLAKKYDVESFLPPQLTQWPQSPLQAVTTPLRTHGLFAWAVTTTSISRGLFAWVESFLLKPLEEGKDHQSPKPDRRQDATFGLWIAPVNETIRSQLDLEKDVGIQVVRVLEDSLAGKAGVKKHDILTKLNGKVIDNHHGFQRDIREALATERFTVEVLHRGKRRTIEVKP